MALAQQVNTERVVAGRGDIATVACLDFFASDTAALPSSPTFGGQSLGVTVRNNLPDFYELGANSITVGAATSGTFVAFVESSRGAGTLSFLENGDIFPAIGTDGVYEISASMRLSASSSPLTGNFRILEVDGEGATLATLYDRAALGEENQEFFSWRGHLYNGRRYRVKVANTGVTSLVYALTDFIITKVASWDAPES